MILMSTKAPIVIERSNLSHAWGEVFLVAVDTTKRDLRPVVVSVGDFDSALPPEDEVIREATDTMLKAHAKNSIDVSAMTIFPYKPWLRKSTPNCAEYSHFCIEQLLPRLKRLNKLNQKGTYFERMMAYSGVRTSGNRTVNQLEFVIDLLKKPRHQRESALQIACFDPAKDHTGQPVRGFPCLQQIGISHDDEDQFAINAVYPTQYIFERAYGNYLGLCHLGHFIANETGLRFVRLNCFVGKPDLGGVGKRALEPLISLVRNRLAKPNNDLILDKGVSDDVP